MLAAEAQAATFVEVLLIADAATLRDRLTHRHAHPERPEHVINASLAGPDDIPALVQAIDNVTQLRPSATLVDASGGLDATVETVRRIVVASP